MRTNWHVSTNIEGLLRNMKGRKINFLNGDDDNPMTDKEARKAITELQAKGHKLIPSAGCEGFDPFGGGCPGHPVEDDSCDCKNPNRGVVGEGWAKCSCGNTYSLKD